MTDTPSRGPDALVWHLERGLGRGMTLLRAADPAAARAAVLHVCTHETRWDPAAEERSHYLVKALATLGDESLEEAVLDRWEREVAWRYSGPWSEVGLILAALGRPRAIEIATLESETEAWEEGPGETAGPEGMSDVKEWLAAIRDDVRLRVGGGLRLGQLARREDMDHLHAALTDESCPHLQEAVAVACNRARDDRVRDWLLDRIEADRIEADRIEADRIEADRIGADGDDARTYWWWQGLSGQRASARARRAALAGLDTVAATSLQWVVRTLLHNFRPDEDHPRLVAAVLRALQIGAEDAVSIALEWMEIRWDASYGPVLIEVVRRSGFGRNRSTALALSECMEVDLPQEDLLDLLEDAEIECRKQAVTRLPQRTVADHLVALGATEGEDPAFLSALGGVFGTD